MTPRLASVAQNLVGSTAVENRRRADALAAAGRSIIDLGFGEPDGDAPEPVKQAACAAIARGESHYVDPRGLSALRERIAAFEHARHGVTIEPSQIVVTTGSLCALSLTFRALLEPGDEAVVLEPFWGPYANMIALVGAKPVAVAARDEAGRLAPDFDALRAAITGRTRLVVLNTPNNPSGHVWTRAELIELASLCEIHDLWIVADEVYSELVYDGHRHLSIAAVSAAAAERTIVATSLSKSFAMTGWRLGYCIAPEAVATVLARINHYTVRCATSFVQSAAVVAFDEAERLLPPMLARYAHRRELVGAVFGRFPDFEYRKPAGTFYAFVRLPAYVMDDKAFVGRVLDEEGVIISAGSAYGRSARRYIRLSFAASEDAIEQGILRIGALADRMRTSAVG